MSLLIASMLAGAAQVSAAANFQPANLSEVFAATCLDGQARLRADEVSAIGFEQLPSDLREKLGTPTSGKVWQLGSSGRSYLYLLDYNAAPGVSPKICGLASEAMDLQSASDVIEARLTGKVEPNKPRSAQWVSAKDGYVATATTAAKFKVLQISWMSEADKRRAQVEAEQFAR